MTAVIRAVFFDFGGVLSTSPFDAFASYEQRSGLPEGFIRSLNATDPDTNAMRGADFLSVPQIGGTKLARHLPVTCTLATELAVRPGPDPMVQVDWARLGAAWSAPYRALPVEARMLVNWGVPALGLGVLVLWAGRIMRKRRQASAGATELSAHATPQIEYPRLAGETVYVG